MLIKTKLNSFDSTFQALPVLEQMEIMLDEVRLNCDSFIYAMIIFYNVRNSVSYQFELKPKLVSYDFTLLVPTVLE